MARRYIRDKNGRFSAKGGGTGKGATPADAFQAAQKGRAAESRAFQGAQAAFSQGRRLRTASASRDVRAGQMMQAAGVRNSQTGRYKKPTAQAQAVMAKKTAKAEKVLASEMKGVGTFGTTRREIQAAARRGRAAKGLTRQRRFARPK